MKFNERFDINVGLEEAQRCFANRVYNELIFEFLYKLQGGGFVSRISRTIASGLGEHYLVQQPVDELIGSDFYRNLRAIEAVYSVFAQDAGGRSYKEERLRINSIVQELLSRSEIDLSVEWRNGTFFPKGAALLDEKLINDVLHWLKAKGFESVLKPFEKGLRHLLESHIRKHVLSDVITDMYEALEALTQKVTGRDKDISANQDSFISKIKASEHYKRLLKDYIEYANYLRHAEREGRPKPELSEREVESFVYLTGIFIRLAM